MEDPQENKDEVKYILKLLNLEDVLIINNL